MAIRPEPQILNDAKQVVPDRLTALLRDIIRALNAAGGGGGGVSVFQKGAAWDAGGSAGLLNVPAANIVRGRAQAGGTIQSAYAIGSGVGSATVEVWKSATGVVPTSANKISALSPITLSAQQQSLDTTLTGWTGLTVTAGDNFAFKLLTATGLSWLEVILLIG